MAHSLKENLIIGMGNPLLDIQATVDNEFLNRYELKANDAILCDDKRLPMFENMLKSYGKQVEYIAGGSTQNSMRVLQWMLNEKKPIATFSGCIGKDEFGKILSDKAKEAGIKTIYQINEETPTGTCAVCISGHNRSLCANLSAAEKFTLDHIEKHWSLIENAKFYYSAGFLLTVCPSAMLKVAQHAAETNKVYCMNLSAPFLVTFFKEPMTSVLPYVDILFGNSDEMKPFAEEHSLKSSSVEEIAREISNMPKVNKKRQRIVIITQGIHPVIVAQGSETTKYPVKELKDDEIVDTNGAGDAFVGGFLSQYIQGRSMDRCVKAAIWAAQQIIQRSGCTLPEKCSYQDEEDAQK